MTALLPIQLPDDLEKQRNMTRVFGPMHMGDVDETAGSWCQPGSALTTVDISGVKQWMED